MDFHLSENVKGCKLQELEWPLISAQSGYVELGGDMIPFHNEA